MPKTVTRSFFIAVILSISTAPSALAARSSSHETTHAKRSHALHHHKSNRRVRPSQAGAVRAQPRALVSPSISALLGDSTIESQHDYVDAGQSEAFRLRAGASGNAGQLHLYVDTGNKATTVTVGLYRDAGAHPGSLLSTGSLSAPKAGAWSTIALSSTAITSGTSYWLAVLGTNGALRYRDHGHGSCPSQTSAQSNLTALPASWSPGTSYSDCPISAYITAGGSTPPIEPVLPGTPPIEPTPPVKPTPPVEPSPPTETTPPAETTPPTEPTPPVEPTPPAAPENVALPAVSGTPTQGKVLQASKGTWTEDPTSYTYKWEDCHRSGTTCATVTGASASTYKLGSADVAHTVRVVVTSSNTAGATSATSAPTAMVASEPAPTPAAPANTTLPAISGTTIQGETLSSTKGSWSGSPSGYAYQWQDCNTLGASCTNIQGATTSSHSLSSGDVGNTIRVIVTATNEGGTTSASSAQSAVIAQPAKESPEAPPTETTPPAEETPPTETTPPAEESGCTSTVSSVSQVNAALSPGAVVCLSAGSYGSLSLTASPSSNATVTAAPGADVTVTGVSIGGKNLTVSQLHSTGGIEVNSGGGNDVISHNDVTDPHGYGISVLCSKGCSASDVISNVTIQDNKIHETNSADEGDALRFDGWSNIKVIGNDIYDIKECPGDDCHTDTLQSYNAQLPTTGLTIEKNYVHDCTDAQGFPFLKDGDIANVTIRDNLSVRMASSGEITGIWIDENSSNLNIQNNTYIGTSGSVLQAGGSAAHPATTVNHNVFDELNTPAGGYSLSENYDVFTKNNEWSFNIGAQSSLQSNPGFVNTATDDYRLASNPNGIGIDWSPASQQYGPSN